MAASRLKIKKQRCNDTLWMENNEMKHLKIRQYTGWIAITSILFLAVGCVTMGPVEKEPVKPAPAPAPEAAKETPPGQLDDGRDGFVITETASMSGADRNAFDRAVAHLNAEAFDEAIAILEKIVAQSPVVSAPYINLGIAYSRTGKNDAAETQFKKALELVPGHPVAGNECGLLYRKKGRFEEARAVYEQTLAAYPNYYPVHRNLGILCDLYLDDLESALAHYQTYSQAIPKDAQVKLWIADLQARMGSK